jgi:hypothetical protein
MVLMSALTYGVSSSGSGAQRPKLESSKPSITATPSVYPGGFVGGGGLVGGGGGDVDGGGGDGDGGDGGGDMYVKSATGQ